MGQNRAEACFGWLSFKREPLPQKREEGHGFGVGWDFQEKGEACFGGLLFEEIHEGTIGGF